MLLYLHTGEVEFLGIQQFQLQGGLLFKWSRILPVTFLVLRICASLILQVGADLVQEKIPGNFLVSRLTLCAEVSRKSQVMQ